MSISREEACREQQTCAQGGTTEKIEESEKTNHSKGWDVKPLAMEVRLCHGLGMPETRCGLNFSIGACARLTASSDGYPCLPVFPFPFRLAAGGFFLSFFSYRWSYCFYRCWRPVQPR